MMSYGRKIISGVTSKFATFRLGQSSLRRYTNGPMISRRDLSTRVRPCFFSTTHYNQIKTWDHGILLNLQTSIRPFSKKLIPRKAALKLTPKARETFQKLIAATDSQGIMLRYEISSQHALRMAFKFDLIKDLNELTADDEGYVCLIHFFYISSGSYLLNSILLIIFNPKEFH